MNRPPPPARLVRLARRVLGPDRGQALVETALVLPLLLMLLFGIIDMSLMMYDYLRISNCAREAARIAAVRGANAATSPYCTSAGVTPTISPSNYQSVVAAPAGSTVTSTVQKQHNWIVIGHLVPGLGSRQTLTVRVSMRMEGEQI